MNPSRSLVEACRPGSPSRTTRGQLRREGPRHSVFLNRVACKTSTVPRHREINDFLARKILPRSGGSRTVAPSMALRRTRRPRIRSGRSLCSLGSRLNAQLLGDA